METTRLARTSTSRQMGWGIFLWFLGSLAFGIALPISLQPTYGYSSSSSAAVVFVLVGAVTALIGFLVFANGLTSMAQKIDVLHRRLADAPERQQRVPTT